MIWFNLLMLLVRAATALFGWLRDRQLIKAGEDAAVARAAKELLERTEIGKRLREQVKALSPAEEDDLWDRMTRQ
jgi:hypothetical protein